MTLPRSAGPATVPSPYTDADDLTPAPGQPRRSWVETIMGMPISVHVRGPLVREDTGPVPGAVAAAMDDLRRTDRIFSTWSATSEVSRLRRGELTLAACDPWVAEVADLCAEAARRTDGWFDGWLPDADGVRRFEPTGLVKGWAVERVTRTLSARLPEHDVLVNAGGDVAVRCRRTDTPAWVLGVLDPSNGDRVVARLALRSGAMATSGSAARGAHVLVPATGERVARAGSVTVVGPDLTWADVHATAGYAMGEAAVAFLRGLPDHVGYVVHPDGSAEVISPTSSGQLPADSQG